MSVGTEPILQSARRVFRKRAILGLQLKFTLLVLCLALVVAGVVGGLLFDLTGAMAVRQRREQCLQMSSLAAKCAADALARGDRAFLASLAEQCTATDSVLFVAFTDPAGRVLALADPAGTCPPDIKQGGRLRPNDGTLGHPRLRPATNGRDAHLEVGYPITAAPADEGAERTLLGYTRLGIGVTPAVRRVTATFDLWSGIVLGAVLLAIPLAYLVVRCVVVPIKELSRVVGRFANGDLEARSTVRRHDEIGELADAFNGMADELACNHQQIVVLNADLERRVRQRTRQLRELASREPLTGLYNRRHFDEVLTSRFSEATRYGSDLSCLMMDLDDFKRVNDRFGHHVGDELLILSAISVASQLRAADVGARFGGDEFIVLLPQTDSVRAQVLAKRIAEKFALDTAEQLPDVRTSLSIGIASLADAGAETAEQLIQAADRALYRAKALGKSRIALAEAVA